MQRHRVLVINPNTSEEITQQLIETAMRLAAGRLTFIPATAEFGAPYLTSRTGVAIGQMAAIDALARNKKPYDAVWLCCFGDPGLEALREVAGSPVIGLAEPACCSTAKKGLRFSIVTGGLCWGPMLEDMVRVLRLEPAVASIRTLPQSADELRKDPAAATNSLADCVMDCLMLDGAEAVILGGAGLARLVAPVRAVLGPKGSAVVCPFEAAIDEIETRLAACTAAPCNPPLSVASSLERQWFGLSTQMMRFLERVPASRLTCPPKP